MTIVQELEQAQAQIVALQLEVKTGAEDLAKAVELNGKLHEQIDAINKAHVDARAALQAQIDKATADQLALTGERDKALSERDEARKALKNPAFAVAAVRGDTDAVPEGGVAKVAAVSLISAMNAIPDPVARAEFYHANKDAIRAELKQ